MTDALNNNRRHDDVTAAQRAAVVREKAIAEAPRHARLLTSARDGRILSAIMRPLFAIATPPGYGLLTTTGRKTGKPRRKCIRAIRKADKAYVVMLRPPAVAIDTPDAVSAWVWNIRANPNVRLKLGRRTYSGVVREIDEPDELRDARAAICETIHLTDYGECDLHLRGLPTRSKIADLHRYWFDTGLPLAVDLL